MESNCCGASEWLEDTGICSICKEPAEFEYDDEVEDNRWVILEEGYLNTAFLTEDQAKRIIEKYRESYPNLTYTLFYDEYYEFSEINKTN
jgi:hypothetical protein